MARPRLLAAFVMVLWALCYPLISLGLEDSPHLTFATMRGLIAGVTLLTIARLTGARLPRSAAEWGWITLAGLGMTGLGYFGMFHAAEFVAPGLATVLESLQPLIAGVLAYIILKERMDRIGWLGLALGFIGVALITIPKLIDVGGGSTGLGLLFIALATTSVAVGNIAIKKIANQVDPAMAMGLQLIIGIVPIALIALATENPLSVNWTPKFTLSLLGLALPGTALAFWLWQTALQSIDVSKAVAFSFLIPLLGISVGALFFGETIGISTLVGGLLVSLGIYLATQQPKANEPISPQKL